MQAGKFRHEWKHIVSFSELSALRPRLKAVMQPDRNTDENGRYFIRSLYFDNFQNKVLREKQDGQTQREKFRLRFYRQDPAFIRLEKKEKVNGLCRKQSAVITREECEQLLYGHTDWMRQSGRPLLTELYAKMRFQCLRPRTIVDYIREAYVFPAGNVRVTLDSAIRTGNYATEFFNFSLPTLPATPPGYAILEVKYDEFLPRIIADIVQTGSRPTAAFSKYVACRMYG